MLSAADHACDGHIVAVASVKTHRAGVHAAGRVARRRRRTFNPDAAWRITTAKMKIRTKHVMSRSRTTPSFGGV